MSAVLSLLVWMAPYVANSDCRALLILNYPDAVLQELEHVNQIPDALQSFLTNHLEMKLHGVSDLFINMSRYPLHATTSRQTSETILLDTYSWYWIGRAEFSHNTECLLSLSE